MANPTLNLNPNPNPHPSPSPSPSPKPKTFGQIHEIHLMAPSAKTGDRCAFVRCTCLVPSPLPLLLPLPLPLLLPLALPLLLPYS